MGNPLDKSEFASKFFAFSPCQHILYIKCCQMVAFLDFMLCLFLFFLLLLWTHFFMFLNVAAPLVVANKLVNMSSFFSLSFPSTLLCHLRYIGCWGQDFEVTAFSVCSQYMSPKQLQLLVFSQIVCFSLPLSICHFFSLFYFIHKPLFIHIFLFFFFVYFSKLF